MIKVTIKFAEVTIGDGSKYLISPPESIPDGFDFSELVDNGHFRDWILEESENNLYDMTTIAIPSPEFCKQTNSSMIGRIEARFGDCKIKRITEGLGYTLEVLN
jgi:hypothetical protein|tara:strand:+ start:1040 stop:1351 length:312 start_codon:yes stop_codon:yes gene_type:complete